MTIKRYILPAICMVLALAVLLTACPASAPTMPPEDMPQNVELNIVGFRVGTSNQLRIDTIAEAIRIEYPDWKVNSLSAGGEAQLVSKYIAGETDLCLSMYPRPLEVELQAPLHPEIDYEQATAYSLVLPSSPRIIHFFARGNTGLNSIREIVDQKRQLSWGIGAGGSTLVVDKLLEYYGVSWEEAEGWGMKRETLFMTSPDGAEALQAGRVDIGISWTAIPCPAYMGVTFDIKLLPIDDPGLVQLFSEMGFGEAAIIPAGTYPFVTEDIPTASETSHLVARPDLPEDVVYYALKALFNQKDFLSAAVTGFENEMTAEAIADSWAISQRTGIPFHPGAIKFYQEMGWIEQ
jgi:TRAP transporter TAXI family solute receptor